VEEFAIEFLEKALREDSVLVDMNSTKEPLKIGDFVKSWSVMI
jgi:hypothetical protein